MAQKKSPAAAKTPLSIDEVVTLNQAYASGNFYEVRAEAKILLRSTTASDIGRQAAQKMLKMTGIDPLSLVAGLLGFVFTAAVAFLVTG